MMRGRPWPLHRGHRTSRSDPHGGLRVARLNPQIQVNDRPAAVAGDDEPRVFCRDRGRDLRPEPHGRPYFSGIATCYPGLELLASGLAFPDPVTTGGIHHCLPFSLWSTRKRAKNYTGSGGVSDSGERCNAFNTESRGSCRCVGHSRLGSRRHRRSKKLLPAHSRKSPGRPDHRAGREGCRRRLGRWEDREPRGQARSQQQSPCLMHYDRWTRGNRSLRHSEDRSDGYRLKLGKTGEPRQG